MVKKNLFITGIVFFIIGFIFINSHELLAGFSFILAFLLLPISIILYIIGFIKNLFNKDVKDDDIKNLTPYLCSISNLRKKDGQVKKGDCIITFEDNSFIISQNEEKIINNIDSIYYLDIWDYKDDTYFKIVMSSHTEYIFKSIYFEADKISDYLKTKGVKIEDNRKD